MTNNTNMTSQLVQQFKQDGQKIKQLAQSRLDQWDVSESVMHAITSEQTTLNNTSAKSWCYGLAAAIGLTVMIWSINSTDLVQTDPTNHQQQIAAKPIELNLKQLPLSLEQKINQPLLDEQQAIIEDLKTLKAQLLSI